MKFILFLGLLSVLTGCATLNEDQCRAGDWYGLGLKNGKDGRNLLSEHTKACSEYGIAPHSSQYNKGMAEGIKTYCTPENGYRAGVDGKQYYNVCPGHMEKSFLKKYRLGKKIYENDSKLKGLHTEVEQLETRLTNYSGDQGGRANLESKIRQKRMEISTTKKKLIFLKAKAGYDIEDIVDYF